MTAATVTMSPSNAPTLHISHGNSKLKDTFIFSMPPIRTCPGGTDACVFSCYAIKAWRQYPDTRTAWSDNFAVSQSDDFVDMVTQYVQTELSSKRKTAKFRYFRIHESGDFYNQAYVNKWFAIARRFPQIHFLAYTKSGWLDFSNAPANLMIRLSLWQDTNTQKIARALDADMPRAIMDGMSERESTHHCEPGDKCGACRYCWLAKTDVQFTLH